MGLFRRIRQPVGDGPSPDQAVLVHIAGPMHDGIGLDDLEDALIDAVEPVLWRAGLPAGSHAIVRYGEPGAEEQRIDLR